jgi:hypothetical protein
MMMPVANDDIHEAVNPSAMNIPASAFHLCRNEQIEHESNNQQPQRQPAVRFALFGINTTSTISRTIVSSDRNTTALRLQVQVCEMALRS